MIIHRRKILKRPWRYGYEVTHVSRTPCRRPVRFTVGRGTPAEKTVEVDCGRRMPGEQQCHACRHRCIDEEMLDLFAATTESVADNHGPMERRAG